MWRAHSAPPSLPAILYRLRATIRPAPQEATGDDGAASAGRNEIGMRKEMDSSNPSGGAMIEPSVSTALFPQHLEIPDAWYAACAARLWLNHSESA